MSHFICQSIQWQTFYRRNWWNSRYYQDTTHRALFSCLCPLSSIYILLPRPIIVCTDSLQGPVSSLSTVRGNTLGEWKHSNTFNVIYWKQLNFSLKLNLHYILLAKFKTVNIFDYFKNSLKELPLWTFKCQ